MRISGVDTLIKSSREVAQWRIVFDITGGVPVLVKSASDIDQGIGSTTVVASGGAGVVNLRFPKCNQLQVLSKNLSPSTPGTATDYWFHEVTDQLPTSGTAKLRFVGPNGTAAFNFPSNGSRYWLILGLA